jgi:hypothetical protein
MSEAPERIWLTGFVKDEYGARLGRGTISDLDHGQNPDYPEYVRADRIKELELEVETWKSRAIHQNEVAGRLEAKLSKSEALLAKAMEALEKVAQYDMQYLAINTLAELSSVSCANTTGGKDE